MPMAAFPARRGGGSGWAGSASPPAPHCFSARAQPERRCSPMPVVRPATRPFSWSLRPRHPRSRPPPLPARPAPRQAKSRRRKQAAEAEAARVSAELENARLRSELQQERLRAIDSKLDALLDAQITSQPVYGAVGVVPFGVVPKPFPVCRGNAGQTPWVNCRPGRDDLNKKRFVEQRPNCGITGCTPTTNTCGIAGCTPTILRVPERDSAGRVRMR